MMSKFRRSLKTLLLCTGLAFSTSLISVENEFLDFFEQMRIDIGNTTGNYIGIQRNYFEFGAFVPLSYVGKGATFIDTKGYYFQNDKWAANVGVGMRTPAEDPAFIWGANVYYDYLEGRFKDYHRMGAGIEFLCPYLDLRINGYFPLNKHYSSKKLSTEHGYQVFHNKKEFAVGNGFDAEIGMPIGSFCDFTTYGAAGTYYYDFSKTTHRPFWGASVRLEADWNTYLSLQLRASYDQIYHAQAQFLIEFTLPFDVLTGCCENFEIIPILQSVNRTGVIFTDSFSYYFW